MSDFNYLAPSSTAQQPVDRLRAAGYRAGLEPPRQGLKGRHVEIHGVEDDDRAALQALIQRLELAASPVRD